MKPFKDPLYVAKPVVPDIVKYKLYLDDMIASRMFSNGGKHVTLLEEKLRDLLEVNNNASFCNGTIALMVALRSLNLTGSVITTAFTFPATANALLWNNLTPIFCDVDYETMNITPESAAPCITKEVSAILPVHVFGTPCDVFGFEELTDDSNLKLIYDAAHAFMVKVGDRSIGSFGDISMFSFHPTKLFHTSEGGMLTYNSIELDVIIKQLRNFGIKDDITGSVREGINGKMNELQGIMGLCILDELEKERSRRVHIATIYTSFLGNVPWIKLLKFDDTIGQSYQYFPIRIQNKSRDEVHDHLKKYNIFARKYFFPLCNDFEHFKYIKADLPISKLVSEEVLCLPFYGDLSDNDIEKICEILIGA